MGEKGTILVSEGPAEDFATYEPGTVETAQEEAADGRMEPTEKEAREEWNPEQLIRQISLRLRR